MRSFIKLTFIAFITIFILSGCTGGTPECGDSETKDLVIQIAKDELKKKGMGNIIPKLNFEVDGIRTTKHNKDVDSYQCAAEFKMIGDKTETLSITYTVESTDDGNEFYVNVYGF